MDTGPAWCPTVLCGYITKYTPFSGEVGEVVYEQT
jgi:hypothetical protein